MIYVIKRLEAQVAEQTAQLQRSSDELDKAIAAQRQTEETLKESVSKYLLHTENASDVVWQA